ncbi:hypothetical protein D045_2468 [Vibrio parahaemolyticus VP-NY4]|nr:hypothetical protein D045_2468 [Vibrio parahaemolyticus VP-NY4]
MWALVDDNPIRYFGIKLGFNETKWPLSLRTQHSQFKHYFM